MAENYRKIFTYIKKLEPPRGLLNRILLQISEENQRLARIRIICFGAISLIALFALVPAWQEFSAELNYSGFSRFASLIFSDMGLITAYWQDFSLLMVESFPAFGLAAIFLSVFAFLFSLRFLVRDISAIFHRSNLATI